MHGTCRFAAHIALSCAFIGALPSAHAALTSYQRDLSAIVLSSPDQDLADPSPIFSPVAQQIAGTVTNAFADLASSAFVDGSVDYGAIRALVRASASDAGLSVGGAASASAYVFAYWFDKVTLGSSTLPAGTPVQVEFDLLFQGNLDGDIGYSVGAPPQGTAAFGGWGSAAYFDVPDSVGPFRFTQTVLFDTTVGASFNPQASLTLHTGAYVDRRFGPSNYTPSSVTTTIDAGHSAAFALRILTPGVTYFSESGTVYPVSLPVPEPGTAGLVAMGMILLSVKLGVRRVPRRRR